MYPCAEPFSLKFWLLDHLPMRMRGWPWLKRYYWQQEELDRAREEAKRLAEDLGWK